jgi:hypothetical protein
MQRRRPLCAEYFGQETQRPRNAGIDWIVAGLDGGQPIPSDLNAYDAMIVMGGEVNVQSNAIAFRQPHTEFSLCKCGLLGRFSLPHFAGEFPSVEVLMIDRVLTDRVRRTRQGSKMLSADCDFVN